MQKRGNWLQCFSHAHILAPNQPLEMLTWVELLPRLLVLLCYCYYSHHHYNNIRHGSWGYKKNGMAQDTDQNTQC